MTGCVEGLVDPAFRAVREVFEATLADGLDRGAGVSVFVGGRAVVDLWGGVADSRSGRVWERDTACVAYSCTKAVTAAAALRVADAEGISMESAVGSWWPEFDCAGKEETRTADLFTHSAGLPVIERTVSMQEAADPAYMAALLTAQEPLWEPGTRHGYHAFSYGWLTGELVRRHTGASVGDYVRRHFGSALRLGVSDPEQVARVEFPPPEEAAWTGDPAPIDAATAARMARAFRDPESLIMRASMNPRAAFGKPEVLAAGWPAVGLVTTPRALATFYRDLIADALLPPEVLRDAIRERVRGADAVLESESAYGLGFALPSHNMIVPDSARPTVFGHPGAGGSIGLGDIGNQVAFAYIPNLRREWLAGDRRAYRLIEAVYQAL